MAYKINRTGENVSGLLDKVDEMNFRPMTAEEAAEIVHNVFGTNND